MKNLIFAILFVGSIFEGVATGSDISYRDRIEAGINNAEFALVNTLYAFQPPLNKEASFCLSLVTRSTKLDVDSIYRLISDKDAEAILPQLEKARQDEVRAAIGAQAWSLVKANLEDATKQQRSLTQCQSAKEQTIMKTKVMMVFADLIKSHSSIQTDNSILFAWLDKAGSQGLLTPTEVTLVKNMASP